MAAAAQRSVVMVASKRLGLLFVSGKNAGGLVVQVVLPQMSPLSGRPERWAKQVRHMSMCSRTNVWVEHDALVRVQLRQQALRVCAPAARSRAPVRQNSLRSPVCTSKRFRGLQNKLGPGSLTGLLDGLSLVLAIRREVCAHAREIVSQPARKQCEGTLLTKERDDVEGWGDGLPCAGAKEVLRGCCALRCVLTTPTSVVTCDKEASQEREGQRRQRTSRVDFGLGTWHW